MRLLSFSCKERFHHTRYTFGFLCPSMSSASTTSARRWRSARSSPTPSRAPRSPERQADALVAIASQPGVAEAVLVSTCNRTEVYCRSEDAGAVQAWLEAEAAKSGVALADHLAVHPADWGILADDAVIGAVTAMVQAISTIICTCSFSALP